MDNMDIIDVYGKKYIKQSPPPHTPTPSSSDQLRPILTKPIDIINPINSIKPIFSCHGQCDKCRDKNVLTNKE